jgi:hypothetical protein
MGQDSTRVLLGVPLSSARDVARYDSDPASFPAGLAVSLNSSGTLSLLKSAGLRIGVSLGRSLSNIAARTAVCRAGEGVPMRAHLKRATGVITISSYANLLTTAADTISVAGTAFTAQSGAATLGQATFQAATSNNATATSLAAQINAHATVSLKVYAVASSATVTLYSVADGVGTTGTGNDIALSYTDNGGGNIGATLSGLSGGKLSGGSDTISSIGYMTIGAKAYVNDFTGKLDIAMSGFSTVTDAIYINAPLTGVAEDSSEVAAGIVDMTGGL